MQHVYTFVCVAIAICMWVAIHTNGTAATHTTLLYYMQYYKRIGCVQHTLSFNMHACTCIDWLAIAGSFF